MTLPDVVNVPVACHSCEAFEKGLEQLALQGETWLQRDKLGIVYRWHHHHPFMFAGTRAWAMLSALKSGGWPYKDLRRIAELLVEVDPDEEAPDDVVSQKATA